MLRVLLIAALLASPRPLGEIFGDLRLGEKYLGDVPLRLTCGDETVTGKTDAAGSFRLSARAGGKCTVTVTIGQASPSVEVVLFDRPTRYRLVLEQTGGSYVLKRV